MPTATFFKLPEEKRNKLVSAIKAELSRASFDKISINKIIQQANIPRGSFYQYFSDKRDMFGYIADDYQQRMIKDVLTSLQRSGGNLFVMFEDMLDFIIRFGADQDSRAYCKNLFADILINNGSYFNLMDRDKGEALLPGLIPHINTAMLDLRSTSDFLRIFEILMSVTLDSALNSFCHPERIEDIRLEHHQKIALLRRGIAKEKD